MSEVNVEEVRDLCRRSLYFLCTEILGYKDWDIIHDDLEKMLNRPSNKKLIMLPRGHLKTAIATKAFVIQKILQNPNYRILICNQVWDRAKDMLFEIKEFLTTKSILPDLFGTFIGPKWHEEAIVIKQRTAALSAPSIATAGVESELTSSHFDLIICDDLVGLTNSQTKEQRDKTRKFWRLINSLLDPGSMEIDIGTRWHFDDYYNDILTTEKEFYDIMIRQVVEDGKIIFPKKFNLRLDSDTKQWSHVNEKCMDYINFLKKKMGSDFYSQYMNMPVDDENSLFKRKDFQYWTKRPSGMYIATTIDPALSSKQSADYTAIVTCGMDETGKIYVLDYLQGHWGGPSEIVDKIFETAERWHPRVIGLEENSWQKTLRWWLDKECNRRGKPLPMFALKAPQNMRKEYKIKALEPYYSNHMVYHASWMRELEDQLLNFTIEGSKSKHDDLIDALSYQLELLVPGPEAAGVEAPPGSWEYEFNEAQRLNNRYRDFFND